MIYKFTAENFYSIKEEQEINFLVDGKSQLDTSSVVTNGGTRVSLVQAVIGPNASGKTNLLRSLTFIDWFIADSFRLSPEKKIPFQQFIATKDKKKPSKFETVFEVEGDIYTYKVRMSRVRVFDEKLRVRNITSKNQTTKSIFDRKWNTRHSNYDLSSPGLSVPKGFSSTLRENASLISTGYRFNEPLCVKIVSYWRNIHSNVQAANHDELEDLRSMFFAHNALTFYKDEPEYRKKAESMLARYDIGFHRFDTDKETDEIMITHKFQDKKISLPLEYESSGSKQLFILLRRILVALEEGGLVITDELDANLHPDMVEELVNLFTDKVTNPKNAQILLSTHSHRLLSELRKYQITITEKNEEGSTEAWRLDSLKGVRADDNYFNKYMTGAYGGVHNFR